MEACYAIECVLHGCDVLNKRGFARPNMLSEHTLLNILPYKEDKGKNSGHAYNHTHNHTFVD